MAASVGVTDMVEPPVGAVAFQAVDHVEQRNVRLGDGLVEPIFFEEIVVLGMANERQMGVQDQAEVTDGHVRVGLEMGGCLEAVSKLLLLTRRVSEGTPRLRVGLVRKQRTPFTITTL